MGSPISVAPVLARCTTALAEVIGERPVADDAPLVAFLDSSLAQSI